MCIAAEIISTGLAGSLFGAFLLSLNHGCSSLMTNFKLSPDGELLEMDKLQNNDPENTGSTNEGLKQKKIIIKMAEFKPVEGVYERQ